MYCPGCGQQQISDEMRFCSRCGLPISGLAEWLASGGVPAPRREQKQVALTSPRRQGIRRGAKLLFLSAVLFPIFLLLSIAFDEGTPLIIPFLIFFASLVIMLYARLFSDPTPSIRSQAQTSNLGTTSAGAALPPASNWANAPGDLGRQRVKTSELAHPPSVTEHTTKLLDKE